MRFTNGSISASTISDVLLPPIKPSITSTVLINIELLTHWCLTGLLKTFSWNYITTITWWRILWNSCCASIARCNDLFFLLNSSEKNIPMSFREIRYFSTDFWLIGSWKALVPCVVTKMPEVISVTNAASWSMPLNSSYQDVKCVVILPWLRRLSTFSSIYQRLITFLVWFLDLIWLIRF